MADWQLIDDASRVFHVPTGFHVVVGGGSRLAQAYAAFVAGGGTPDPATDYRSLADRKTDAKAQVDGRAQEIAVRMTPSERTPLHYSERLAEARLADADGAITAGEYPLLEAEVPETGANVAAVATAVLAEWADLRRDLASVEERRWFYHDAIDTAVSAAAVEVVLNRLSWPPMFPPTTPLWSTLYAVPLAGLDVPRTEPLTPLAPELVAVDPVLVFADV